jgi:hypothetical protein
VRPATIRVGSLDKSLNILHDCRDLSSIVVAVRIFHEEVNKILIVQSVVNSELGC